MSKYLDDFIHGMIFVMLVITSMEVKQNQELIAELKDSSCECKVKE